MATSRAQPSREVGTDHCPRYSLYDSLYSSPHRSFIATLVTEICDEVPRVYILGIYSIATSN